MTTQNPCALAPVVSIVKNQVTALSTDVAKFFHKEHFNVVRDIEKLLKSLPISRAFNFEESTISIPSNLNNTSNRVIKAYRMTRDGFTLLVMGWTGEKALQFKLAWLDAFNAMEEQLRKQQCLAENNLATLTPAQQYAIKSAVAARAQKEPAKYKEIYSALKRRFQVARYDQIMKEDYEEALTFIREMQLAAQLPARPKQNEAEPVVVNNQEVRYELGMTRAEIESFAQFIYCWKYLFRPSLVTFRELLSAVHSPLAGNLYDATFDTTLNRLEEVFRKHGIPVGPEHLSRTLPFYP